LSLSIYLTTLAQRSNRLMRCSIRQCKNDRFDRKHRFETARNAFYTHGFWRMKQYCLPELDSSTCFLKRDVDHRRDEVQCSTANPLEPLVSLSSADPPSGEILSKSLRRTNSSFVSQIRSQTASTKLWGPVNFGSIANSLVLNLTPTLCLHAFNNASIHR
jgi:hypothetical protein